MGTRLLVLSIISQTCCRVAVGQMDEPYYGNGSGVESSEMMSPPGAWPKAKHGGKCVAQLNEVCSGIENHVKEADLKAPCCDQEEFLTCAHVRSADERLPLIKTAWADAGKEFPSSQYFCIRKPHWYPPHWVTGAASTTPVPKNAVNYHVLLDAKAEKINSEAGLLESQVSSREPAKPRAAVEEIEVTYGPDEKEQILNRYLVSPPRCAFKDIWWVNQPRGNTATGKEAKDGNGEEAKAIKGGKEGEKTKDLEKTQQTGEAKKLEAKDTAQEALKKAAAAAREAGATTEQVAQVVGANVAVEQVAQVVGANVAVEAPAMKKLSRADTELLRNFCGGTLAHPTRHTDANTVLTGRVSINTAEGGPNRTHWKTTPDDEEGVPHQKEVMKYVVELADLLNSMPDAHLAEGKSLWRGGWYQPQEIQAFEDAMAGKLPWMFPTFISASIEKEHALEFAHPMYCAACLNKDMRYCTKCPQDSNDQIPVVFEILSSRSKEIKDLSGNLKETEFILLPHSPLRVTSMEMKQNEKDPNADRHTYFGLPLQGREHNGVYIPNEEEQFYSITLEDIPDAEVDAAWEQWKELRTQECLMVEEEPNLERSVEILGTDIESIVKRR